MTFQELNKSYANLPCALADYEKYKPQYKINWVVIISLLISPLFFLIPYFFGNYYTTITYYLLFLFCITFFIKKFPLIDEERNLHNFFEDLSKGIMFKNFSEYDMYCVLINYANLGNLIISEKMMIAFFCSFDTEFMKKSLRYFRLLGYGHVNRDKLELILDFGLKLQIKINERCFCDGKTFKKIITIPESFDMLFCKFLIEEINTKINKNPVYHVCNELYVVYSNLFGIIIKKDSIVFRNFKDPKRSKTFEKNIQEIIEHIDISFF